MAPQREVAAVGNSDQPCEQAGLTFRVRLTVAPTPNPNFRRVDVQVRDLNDYSIIRISTVVGRF